MYHLPEARDIAVSGPRPRAAGPRAAIVSLARPRGLSVAGLLPGGESGGRAESAARIIQLLQYATGLCVFGAALALAPDGRARRGVGPLIVLALAAFPDRDAAAPLGLCRLARGARGHRGGRAARRRFRRDDRRRTRCGRRGISLRRCGRHQGLRALRCSRAPRSRAAPASRNSAPDDALRRGALRSDSARPVASSGAKCAPDRSSTPYAASPARASRACFDAGTTSRVRRRPEKLARDPASAAAQPLSSAFRTIWSSTRACFEPNGDGYNGLLVLLLLARASPGWDARRNLLFLAAALPFLVPWSLLVSPVDAISLPRLSALRGLHRRGTLALHRGASRVRPAGAAGVAVLVVGRGVPGAIRLERSRMEGRPRARSREEVLAARLPSVAFSERLRPEDRVVLVGENDRFHLPAERRVARRVPSRVGRGADDP